MTGRFATLNENDLKTLELSKHSANTQRIVKRSISLFREFLGNENVLENLEKEEINRQLRLFFGSVRNKNGEEMKKSSFQSIKYGVTKYLKDNLSIDINNHPDFASCHSLVKAKVVDLNRQGKGAVEHKQEIAEADMEKLRDPDNIVFDTNTPCGLQKKCWFDLMYYLCRRGRENLREMNKSTFAFGRDASGREYVFQDTDEADKNHTTDTTPDDTIGEARMCERPGDRMCPVKSFRTYLQKLHPDIHDLWQRPLDTYAQMLMFGTVRRH